MLLAPEKTKGQLHPDGILALSSASWDSKPIPGWHQSLTHRTFHWGSVWEHETAFDEVSPLPPTMLSRSPEYNFWFRGTSKCPKLEFIISYIFSTKTWLSSIHTGHLRLSLFPGDCLPLYVHLAHAGQTSVLEQRHIIRPSCATVNPLWIDAFNFLAFPGWFSAKHQSFLHNQSWGWLKSYTDKFLQSQPV